MFEEQIISQLKRNLLIIISISNHTRLLSVEFIRTAEC